MRALLAWAEQNPSTSYATLVLAVAVVIAVALILLCFLPASTMLGFERVKKSDTRRKRIVFASAGLIVALSIPVFPQAYAFDQGTKQAWDANQTKINAEVNELLTEKGGWLRPVIADGQGGFRSVDRQEGATRQWLRELVLDPYGKGPAVFETRDNGDRIVHHLMLTRNGELTFRGAGTKLD